MRRRVAKLVEGAGAGCADGARGRPARGWPSGEAGELARRRVDAVLERLAVLYAEPRVREIAVLASTRMTASLARAYLDTAEVRVAAVVLQSRHLEEVMVHEVAHIVCRWQHGRTPAHGRAWRALMAQAGEPPRATLQPSDVRLPPRRRRRRRLPVAQAARRFLRSLL